MRFCVEDIVEMIVIDEEDDEDAWDADDNWIENDWIEDDWIENEDDWFDDEISSNSFLRFWITDDNLR